MAHVGEELTLRLVCLVCFQMSDTERFLLLMLLLFAFFDGASHVLVGTSKLRDLVETRVGDALGVVSF